MGFLCHSCIILSHRPFIVMVSWNCFVCVLILLHHNHNIQNHSSRLLILSHQLPLQFLLLRFPPLVAVYLPEVFSQREYRQLFPTYFLDKSRPRKDENKGSWTVALLTKETENPQVRPLSYLSWLRHIVLTKRQMTKKEIAMPQQRYPVLVRWFTVWDISHVLPWQLQEMPMISGQGTCQIWSRAPDVGEL